MFNMSNELMTLQMTDREYSEYRKYQKFKEKMSATYMSQAELISNLRDQYHDEFIKRLEWSKRAILAEETLDKLSNIIKSKMSDKLKLENIEFELEQVERAINTIDKEGTKNDEI